MASIQTMEVKGELTTRLTIGFRCHPNYGNDMRLQYNHILADINDSKMLQAMISDVLDRPIKIKKFGQIDRNLILNSNYALS